ncbi:hypothetical protein Tco_1098176, partial [Tanacetum coccineum]
SCSVRCIVYFIVEAVGCWHSRSDDGRIIHESGSGSGRSFFSEEGFHELWP